MKHHSRLAYHWRQTRSRSLNSALLISLFCALVMSTQLSPVYPAHSSRAHARAAYTVSGTVFDDYNQNGSQDTREPGLNGVLVTAYNSANAVVTSSSTATNGSTVGHYTLSIPTGTGPVRIQFSNFGASSTVAELKGYQPSSHTGGSTVAFIDGTQATYTINQALAYPADYCQNNPNMATNCYVFGSHSDPLNASAHVAVRFPYNSTGNETANTGLALMPDIGATWGLAYHLPSDTLFMGAYLKRSADFGPGGPGAIYALNGANSASPTMSNALFASLSAGANPRTGATNYTDDTAAYDLVGKMALGGMALSDDQSTLYVMNLADKKLYSIGVTGSAGALTAGTITSTALPSVSDCSASDMRPFAVTVHHATVYVGAVCSAESTITAEAPQGDPTKLQAYVFRFTPGTGFTNTPIYQVALNYKRGCQLSYSPSLCATYPDAWKPWNGNFSAVNIQTPNGVATTLPQPILSSIAFDQGDMILGLRDRYADQVGYGVHSPGGGSTLYAGVASGDTLRACLKTAGDFTSGWTLENNAQCGGVQTAGSDNNQGPGNGEYYYQDNLFAFHDDVGLGGILQVPGFPGVMTTAFDPTTHLNSGGIHTYNNVSGAKSNGYEIYVSSATGIAGSTFAKADGLGSLAAFCQAAPIEIGNRVWNDLNGNGIQDAGEEPIAGVTVNLYNASGTSLVTSTITDANGEYAFPITANTGYLIKLDNAADYSSGGPLNNSLLTSAKQDSSAHVIDSKAVLPSPANAIGTGNYPQIAVSAHTPGQNDYGLDIGFTPLPDLSLTKTNQGGSSFYQGQSITYTLSAHSNAGPVLSGAPITITDTLPAGLDKVTISAPGWQISAVPALAHAQQERAQQAAPLRHPMGVKNKHGLHASLFKLASVTSPLTITASYTGTYPVLAGTDLPPITITGSFTASAVSSIANIASVNTPGDTNASNNSASDTVSIARAPDLALALSHQGSGCVPLGQSVSYTVTVSNGSSAGAVSMGQITVTDTLPAGLSNVSIDGGTDWTIAPTGSSFTATYTGTLPVAPGAQLTPITMTGTVSASAANAQLTDSATVHTSMDSNASNDSNSDSITACAAPDLSIVKTQTGNNPFHIGQQVTFSLSVNNGASAGPIISGQPITVSDTLPTGLSNVRADGGSDWTITISGSALTATYKGSYPIAAGAKLSAISVAGTLNSTAAPSLVNTATVSTPLDTNAANNSSTDTLTVDKQPDLTIGVSHTGETCTKVGGRLTYTVQVRNGSSAGPVQVGETITVSDSLPAELSNLTYNGGADWTISQSGSTLTATYKGTLPVPTGMALPPITIKGTLTNPSTLSLNNTATVSTTLDTNASNNNSTDTLMVCPPDLTIAISHTGGGTMQAGQNITYTITSHNLPNAGPVVAGQPITLSVTLPPGLTTISSTSATTDWQLSNNTDASGTTLTAVYVGSYPLPSGATLPAIQISGTLTSAAVPGYSASAVVKTPQDSNAANDMSSDTITVLPYPDLAVALNHQEVACFKIGQDVIYTLSVSNGVSAGPVGYAGAQPIIATATLPAGMSNVSVSANNSDWQTSIAGNVITASYVGSYPVSASARLSPITITGTFTGRVPSTLTATATVSTPHDTNTSNDTISDTLTTCAPDLAINLTHSGGGDFHTGQTVTYSITVNNTASTGSVLTGQPIIVSDTLPAGLSNVTFASGSEWAISISGSTLTATYQGSLPIAPGATLPAFTITGTLNATAGPNMSNTATVSSPLDSNPANNTATDTLSSYPVPDVSIALTHQGKACTRVGDTVTYSVAVSNGTQAGPLLAGDTVLVKDTLPAALSNITANGGNDWTISLDGSTLTATYKGRYPISAGNALPSFTITGTLTNPTMLSLNNTATVNTPLDSNASNDTSLDTFMICEPDLAVGISHAGTDTLQVGQNVTYTITSHNLPGAGPVLAGQPIALSVTLPPGLTTISSTQTTTDWQLSSNTDASGTTLTAVYIGSYPVLSGVTLPAITVSGTLTEAAMPSYTATAVVKTPQDTNASNDTMSDPITVLPLPNLSVALRHQDTTCFQLEQQVTYTMTVSNAQSAGPLGVPQPITVTNTLPGGLSNVQVTANGRDWLVSSNGSTITATYTGSYPVAAGAQLSPITITATLNNQAQTQMLDTATVSTPQDSNAANNSASASFTMCAPDLAITKTNTGGSSFLVGQSLTYTLRVSNAVNAGAVLRGDPITVTYIAPVGLSHLTAPSSSDWAITLAPSSAATSITATYTGTYPVRAGTTLSDILISGTLTSAAVPNLVNSATVSTPHDGNPANDSTIDTITVSPLPDLSVTLAHLGNACFKPGDTATYTITVKNADTAGAVQAGDFLTVTNSIPGGLASVVLQGGSDWQISQDGTRLTATYKGTYPVLAGTSLPPITMTGIITASPGGRVDNTVRVDTPHEGNPDNNVSGDTMSLCPAPTPTPTVTPTVTPPPAPDLLFSKTHLRGNSFNVGDSITYVMTVRNKAGAGPVPDGMPIVVTDNVPAGLSDVTADGGTDWRITITSSSKGTVVKASYIGLYPIEPGTTLTQIQVTGTINDQAVGGFVNGASVNAPGDSNAGNKKDTSTITVKPKSGPGHGPGAPGGGPGGPPGLPPTGSDPLASER